MANNGEGMVCVTEKVDLFSGLFGRNVIVRKTCWPVHEL